jgi:hypothetical protein
VLEVGIAEVARKYGMDWKVSYSTQQKRLALLVRCAASAALSLQALLLCLCRPCCV